MYKLYFCSQGGNIKKLFWGLIICVVAIVCIEFISYSIEYRIQDDRKQLRLSIMNCGDSELIGNVGELPEIKKNLNLDDKKFVFCTFSDSTGYAELAKGVNNKYKIISQGRGENYIDNRIFETNGRKYLIFWGKNPHIKISYASVELEGNKHKVIIPQEEYYMAYCEVPIKTQSQFVNIENIKLFDANDVDVTNEMFGALLKLS